MKRLIILFTMLSALAAILISPTLAQRPDAPEYARRGEYAIGTRDFTIPDDERPLNITVWYPALNTDGQSDQMRYRFTPLIQIDGHALLDAEPDTTNAPYPLVIFSHGSGGFRFQSLFFTEHLASHGFVVIAADHPTNTILDMIQNETFRHNIAPNYAHRPAEVMHIIEFSEALTASDGDLAGLIDMERIVTAGHSFGGYTALAAGGAQLNFDQLAARCSSVVDDPEQFYGVCFLLEETERIAAAAGLENTPEGAWPPISDSRVRAVVALAPWNGAILDANGLSHLDIPTMIIVGTADPVTPPARDSYVIYNNLFQSTPKALVSLENAGHHIFVDACTELALRSGFFRECSDPVWDMARAHDLTNHFATAFLLSVLYEDDAADQALQPEAVNFVGVDYEIAADKVEQLTVEVLSIRPHDPNAWIQGLLLHDGYFYESTGEYGKSSVRRVDPETGEVQQQVNLPEQLYGEGLALVDDRLIQITWQNGAALVFDLETFDFIEAFPYTGEGWGLCYDGEHLYMSDGSSTIFQRDPETFLVTARIPVTLRGEPLTMINELECVDDQIYANVWQTDYIVRIDKTTGQVTARIDAAGLLTDEELASIRHGGVLNGIAHDPENDVFFITGKLWPKLFEVRFVPAQ